MKCREPADLMTIEKIRTGDFPDSCWVAVGDDGRQYEAEYVAEMQQMFFTIPANVRILGYLKK